MTVHITVPLDDDAKAALDRSARHEGLSAEALVAKLIDDRLEYERWFVAEVEKGQLDARNGDLVPHDQVVREMNAYLEAGLFNDG